MSKLEELIERYCPNGVEYKTLNDISIRIKGMTGVSKKWDSVGNCKFIDYLNAYNNLKIDTSRLENATVKKMGQDVLQIGDILITSASETPDECALSSVIEDNIAQGVFLDDHLFGIRIKNRNYVNPSYVNYCMHSCVFRKILPKAVRGVTRYYVSLPDFMELEIPVPPLPVQEEIVRILDKFTELEEELEEELRLRKKQYEYYKDKMLSEEYLLQYCPDGVEYNPLEKCCNILDNKRKPITKSSRENGEYPYYGANGVQDYVADYLFDGTFILVGEDGSVQTDSGNPVVNWAEGRIWVNNHAHIVEECKGVLLRYLFHYLQTVNIAPLIHGNIPKLTGKDFRSLQIPVPPLPVQEEIVRVLDKFSALTTDISEGLPAEIKMRRQQYEYYRDKLLTFKRLEC